MRTTVRSQQDQRTTHGPRRQRSGFSWLARVGFTLAAVAPAVLWVEPAAAGYSLNHNEAVGRDERA